LLQREWILRQFRQDRKKAENGFRQFGREGKVGDGALWAYPTGGGGLSWLAFFIREHNPETEERDAKKIDLTLSFPATSISREFLRAVKSQGKGDLDSCVVMTVLEAMANTVVKGKDE
jgi:hypothetical protein